MQKGYGVMTAYTEGRKTTIRAHRFAYELMLGAIPDGFEIHHECGNRSCVNPSHLIAVTAQEHARLSKEARRGRTPKSSSKPLIGVRSSALPR
jgi:hypothetical protein